jgi:hypothetical protein
MPVSLPRQSTHNHNNQKADEQPRMLNDQSSNQKRKQHCRQTTHHFILSPRPSPPTNGKLYHPAIEPKIQIKAPPKKSGA